MQRNWKTRTLRFAVLAISLASLAAAARAAEPLRWKFKDGEQLNYILARQMEGKLNLSGADITFKADMTFDTTWKVKKVAADGSAEVEQTLDRLQVAMSSPLGGSLEYDSANPVKPDSPAWAAVEPMVGMIGETFKWKVSPQGRVSDIELPQSLVDVFAKQRGSANRQQGFGIGNNMFSERGIKEFIEKGVLPLPEKAPGKDVAWKQHFENPIPRIGTQNADTTYSFAGDAQFEGKPVAKISAATELTFEPADDAQADLEIISQEGTATFYFDPAAGRVVDAKVVQSSSLELSGARDLTQEISETATIKAGKSPAGKSPAAKKAEAK
jgi:hypothetical protein